MAPWLNALHDILADFVNSMRGFLQISPTNMNEKIATKHFFSFFIDTFHLLHLRASDVKERISSDTLAKRLSLYFS
jgi:hypothetical protein